MKSVRFSKFHLTLRAAAFGGLLVVAQLVITGQAPQIALDLGPDRYLTHVSTDKPIYRGGERLYVRGVVLRADGHSPMTNPPGLTTASFEIKGPKGDIVTSGIAPFNDSVAAFSWDIPEGQAGGEYTVRILQPTGDAPAERKFDIRTYRAPRLKSQIIFARDGYGPGDTVIASLHVERAEGGFPAGGRVAVTARVDGIDVWKGETRIDSSGDAGASFKLPAEIERGEGVLGVVIEDGGIVETAAKAIPILLQSIDVSIYPEGGDLVAGLTNRVYIEGKTPTQKPADMAGVIVNGAGKEIGAFRTEHEGRGRFSFVPLRGETYSLRLTEPSGIKKVFRLPDVKESGVVLTSPSDVSLRYDDVLVRVAATADGTYGVTLSQRGKEISFKQLTLKAHQPTDVAFTVPKTLDGVLIATVYRDNQPVAERLIFRQPEQSLSVKVVAHETNYTPGDKVTLRVATTDQSGKPVAAVVGLTVTDSSVLEMIDKREQAPQLPAMVLLENDVEHLSDAHVYLDDKNPKAPLAIDLLLGTQGWRRFATVDPDKFVTAYKDLARRALAVRTRPAVIPVATRVVGGPAKPIMATAAVVGDAPVGSEYVNGAVMDTASALIPGATVQATNIATGVTTTRLTDESGVYTFRLNPGTYRLAASLPGFQTTIAEGLQVQAGTFVRQNFTLHIASVHSSVEVTVSAERFITASASSVGAVIGPRRQRDLPVAGNNVLDLHRVINPDLVGEIRLVLSPVDAGLGRGNASIAVPTRRNDAGNVLTVREFAHKAVPSAADGSRMDFSETVYWTAAVKTDSSNGTATVTFDLSDSVTSFRVLADGFTQSGALGSNISHIESIKPFLIEPKMPLQVTAGDVIQLPVGIINGIDRELHDLQVTANANAGVKIRSLNGPAKLAPKERTRQLLQLEVAPGFSGVGTLALDARTDRYRDAVTKTLDVQPLGFPHELSAGGVLERNSTKSIDFTLPDEIVVGSVSSSITVYPTPLANMTDALKALIREPNGCFEQTSATSYPLVMAQQYFLTHTGVDPALIEKTRGLLDRAYKRLLGFQSRNHGYEWFGADPGHEALTAYGLMQFTDMSKVRDVDQEMLARTRAWLLSRRNGGGSFDRNPRALDSFGGAPADTTNAYIVWALVEAGERGLEKEIALVKKSATSTQDSYILALAANILYATGDQSGARVLMDRLAKRQEGRGNVQGAVSSITRSGGASLDLETTALSVLAWLREPAYAGAAQKGLKWIAESNQGGRFGSTQSTILSLRSIVAYDAANARAKAPGRIVLSIDGKTVGFPVAFTSETQSAIVVPEAPGGLGPGKHKVALKMEDGSNMPFSISVRYYSTLPESSERAQVGIRVALGNPQIQEGDVTEAVVSIENKSAQAIPTPVAIVGIPGGLEVRHDQLKDLVKSGRIDAYEVIGREVILYWRYLKGEEDFDVPLSLVAAIPGSYTGPASRAYLYYTDEFKSWAPGLKVDVTPR